MLARVIFGAAPTLLGAIVVVVISGVVGIPAGLFAGYYGGRTESIIMRILDALLAFPALLLAILVVATFGRGLTTAVLALGVIYIPAMARLVRSVTLVQRNQAYVDAGVALGYSDRRIIFRHILPNLVAAIVVQSSIDLAYAILDIAALSFLGLGQQPPDPDWGSMLSDGRSYLLQNPLPAMSAGLAIMLAVIAFNLVGDGLRAQLDPGSASDDRLPAVRPACRRCWRSTGLTVAFRTMAGAVHAVNGLDLDLRAGEIVGLVGESGSGKSVTSRAIMGLLPRRTSEVSGSVRLAGRELVGLPESEYRRVRGEQVAIDLPGPADRTRPAVPRR